MLKWTLERGQEAMRHVKDCRKRCVLDRRGEKLHIIIGWRQQVRETNLKVIGQILLTVQEDESCGCHLPV